MCIYDKMQNFRYDFFDVLLGMYDSNTFYQIVKIRLSNIEILVLDFYNHSNHYHQLDIIYVVNINIKGMVRLGWLRKT